MKNIYMVETEDSEKRFFSTEQKAQDYVDYWNEEYYEDFGFESPEEMRKHNLAYITPKKLDPNY